MTVDDFGVGYGRRLALARTAAGLSQSEFAARLGLTRSSVANIEAGRQAAPARQVVVTARELEVSVGWLMTGEPVSAAPRPSRLPVSTLPTWAAQLRKIADSMDRKVT